MREEIRRAVANAVLPMGQAPHRPLYSQTANAWTNFSATDGGFFDHGAQAHVARTAEGLYHHGLGGHVRLELDGSQFTGFDHLTERRFNGVVQGATAVIHDPKTGRHYLFRT